MKLIANHSALSFIIIDAILLIHYSTQITGKVTDMLQKGRWIMVICHTNSFVQASYMHMIMFGSYELQMCVAVKLSFKAHGIRLICKPGKLTINLEIFLNKDFLGRTENTPVAHSFYACAWILCMLNISSSKVIQNSHKLVSKNIFGQRIFYSLSPQFLFLCH